MAVYMEYPTDRDHPNESGFYPGRAEVTACENADCAKEFAIDAGEDDEGRPVAEYAAPFSSKHGKFCSEACELLYRMDMRGSVRKALKLLRYGGYQKAAERLDRDFADYQDAIWGSGGVKETIQNAYGE